MSSTDESVPSEPSFLFLTASARKGVNTERLAREAAAALPGDVAQAWIHLSDLPLPVFEDLRHAAGFEQRLAGSGRTLSDATTSTTDIVFVAPVYWYALPASAKLYLDHWTHWMRIDELKFKARMSGKTFWVATMLSDRDIGQAEPLLGTMRLCAAYFGAKWGGSVVGYGNRPGDILNDAPALADARRLFSEGGDLRSSFV